MIDPNAPDDLKLTEARKLFDQTVSAYEDVYMEIDEDVRFYTGGEEHQWDKEDVQLLHEQDRPVLTLNVIKPIIAHRIGALEDARKEPRATPVTSKDQFAADIINDLHARARHELHIGDHELEVATRFFVMGMSGLAVDVEEDDDIEGHMRITVQPFRPHEAKFDPAAENADYSDAGFAFRDKWLNEPEFKKRYPKFADQWDDILAAPDPQEGHPATTGAKTDVRDAVHRQPLDARWIRREKREVLVVHMEYKVSVEVRRVKPPPGSDEAPEDLTLDELAALSDQEIDDKLQLGYEFDDRVRRVTRIRWLEFAGHEILYDDWQPLPIKRFSLLPAVCRRDYTDGTFEGDVRPLRDPQKEVNKRFSQLLYMLVTQAQPGVDAEAGAIPDIEQYRHERKTPGGVGIVNQGGLDRIRERSVPTFPEAVARIHDQALNLIKLISNTNFDTLTEPRGIPEAAATAQLRHRQSTLSMVPQIRNFQQFQRNLAQTLIELILRSFSDQQIEDMLSNSDRFRVENGVVFDAQNEGQSVDLKTVRTLRYNVEMRSTGDTETTAHMLQFQTMLDLQERGVAVDPTVLVDLTTLPRDLKDRLKQHAARQAEIALQSQQAEMAQRQQEIARITQADNDRNRVELAKLAEDKRHNFASELTQAAKAGMEHAGRILSVLEKADESEIDFLMQTLGMLRQQQQARQQETTNVQ